MPKRKLTARLKEKIKQGKIKLSDYSGEALKYAKQVKSLQKARRIKKGLALKVNGITVARDTELYQIATKLAAQKNIPVAKLSKKDVNALAVLGENGKLYFNREFEYIKNDIVSARGAYYKDEKIDKHTLKMRLVRFRNAAVKYGDIYPYMNMEFYFDLQGAIHLDFPESTEYRPLIRISDEQERAEAFRDLLDKYNIGYTPNN